MQSPYSFLVTPVKGKRYNNTKQIGNIDLVVSTSEENYTTSNREATVIETPINYEGPIEKGDTLLVHHNVFKFYNDMYGNRQSGRSFLKDNLFLVDDEQFFAYKKDNEWIGYDRYCFLKPIPVEESYIYKPLSKEPLMGEVAILNETLQNKGVKIGDKVCYKPNQEYEFKVDNQTLYRLYDHCITLVL